MSVRYHRPAIYVLLAALASQLVACAVYAPMHCAAPGIRARHESEVAATLHVNGRVEAAATYSPVNHLLVRVAGSFRSDANDTTYFRVKHVEVATGYYHVMGPDWVVGALAGFGRGHNQTGFSQLSQSFFSSERVFQQYDGTYWKTFGEAYAMYQRRKASIGLACRLTNIYFGQVSNRGIDFGPVSMYRLEPMVLGRMGPYGGRINCLQFQISAGLSAALSNRKPSGSRDVDNVLAPNLYVSFGAVFYPDRLFHKQ